MITKEVRARVVKTIVGHADNVNVTTNVRVLRQYEDTVTELEKQLMQVVGVLESIEAELPRARQDDRISSGYERELGIKIDRVLSQLEKGDKT